MRPTSSSRETGDGHWQIPHSRSPTTCQTTSSDIYLDATTTWQRKDGAYALIQGTRPYTLARGLNDSPVGLASWIVDKFHAWSDCDGDVEQSFTKDELLTNVTLY
jgi:hypothetical protein